MICPNCGTDYSDSSVFCPQCGMIPPAPAKKGRLWPPILILVLMFAFGAGVYFHTRETAPTTDTPWFSISDGTLYFDESKYTGSPELEIPSTVDGQTVTALSPNCFRYCDELTTVILPDTLATIGEGCFYDCEGLRGVKLPVSLKEIGPNAFYSCGALEAISVPASVEQIGGDAFEGCSRLRYIFYDGSVQNWDALYPEEINKNAQIYTVDGTSPDGFSAPSP